jgi:hypothetical protein
MRRLIALIPLLALLLLTPTGCRMRKKAAVSKASEDDVQMVSVVNMADPKTAGQLTRGFHVVESGEWRWTMKTFSVALRPPKDSEKNGAKLQMRLVIPEPLINRLGPMTLSARVNGIDVGSEMYSKAGECFYDHAVPASALAAEIVIVDFALDKAMAPGEQDSRELGVIASSIGLTPK